MWHTSPQSTSPHLTSPPRPVYSIYSLTSKKEVGTLVEHDGEVTCAAFAGPAHLLTGGSDSVVCIFRVSDWACVHKLGGHKGAVTSVAVHPSHRVALSTAADRTLRLWDLVKGRCAFVYRLPGDGQRVLWSPDASTYCVVFKTEVVLYNAADGQVDASLTHPSRVTDVAFTPKEGVLVTASDDSCLRMFAPDGRLLRTVLTGHKHRVRGVSCAPGDVQRLVTIDSDGLAFVWDTDVLLPDAAAIAGPDDDDDDSDDDSEDEVDEEALTPMTSLKPLFKLTYGVGCRYTCVSAHALAEKKHKKQTRPRKHAAAEAADDGESAGEEAGVAAGGVESRARAGAGSSKANDTQKKDGKSKGAKKNKKKNKASNMSAAADGAAAAAAAAEARPAKKVKGKRGASAKAGGGGGAGTGTGAGAGAAPTPSKKQKKAPAHRSEKSKPAASPAAKPAGKRKGGKRRN